MNSTKPIISANPLAERGVLIAVALLAAGAAFLSVRDARAAYLRELGIEAVEAASDMERSAARDRLLDGAQVRLHDALEVYARDPVLYRAMARTRYLQATGAQVTEVSPQLLEASVAASRQAEALDPRDSEAPARIAQAMSVWPSADKTEAAAALRRSYVRRALDPAGGVWRIQAAAALWPALDLQVRQAALAEACVIARAGGAGLAQVQTATASNGDMQAAFAAVTRQAACAPALSLQSPSN